MRQTVVGAPLPDHAKVNIDGAFARNSEMTIVAVICRDAERFFMLHGITGSRGEGHYRTCNFRSYILSGGLGCTSPGRLTGVFLFLSFVIITLKIMTLLSMLHR